MEAINVDVQSSLVGEVNLVDQLLAEQQQLGSAVAEFSEWHAQHQSPAATEQPAQATYYRNLIPFEKPGDDQQYAFEVNLDSCSGCKGCVSACHSLNGLEEHETWRNVGLILGTSQLEPVQQTVTTACHHCEDPACMNGCPVGAYEKDAQTGIVRHLDDQCIGCQYCILKCPYDVPKYSPSKGIVRKCDMCFDRLSVGEAPACVQACPNEAIKIITVNRADVAAQITKNQSLVAGAYNSDYTRPTTRYVGHRGDAETMQSADKYQLHAEHSHLPLVIMLVLTQLSVGALGVDFLLRSSGQTSGVWLALLATAAGLLGIGASTLHLGQPLKAWRAFLGLRTSWLSREVIGFGGFAGLALGFSLLLLPITRQLLPLVESVPLGLLSAATFFTGLTCLVCSIMVYVDTRRSFWSWSLTSGKFLGTAVVLGLALAGVVADWTSAGSGQFLLTGAALATLGKLAWEALFFRHATATEFTNAKQSALIMLRLLRIPMLARFATSLLGAMLLFVASPPVATIGLLLLLIGELLERYLFFRAVVAYKMPGGF